MFLLLTKYVCDICIFVYRDACTYSDTFKLLFGMSLPDFNRLLSQVLDKHVPACQRKVRQRRITPWCTSVARQLREVKRERRRAKRRWRSSRLTVHKQLHDATRQKVTDLDSDAKTSFYSAVVSSSGTCKELFHNMATLLSKTNKSSLPSAYDLQQLPGIFNGFFKNKKLYVKRAFRLWHTHKKKCRLSIYSLCHHIPVLYTTFWRALKRLIAKLSPKLPC